MPFPSPIKKEMKNLSKEQFIEWAKELVRNNLPEDFKGMTVKTEEWESVNRKYTGLTLVKDVTEEFAAPFLNLDAVYESYTAGMTLDEIKDNLLPLMFRRPPEFVNKMEQFRDYQLAKESLFIRVAEYESNKDVLQDVPFIKYADMAVTVHMLFDDTEAIASALVNNAIFNRWGVTKEQLFEDAMASAPKLMPLSWMRVLHKPSRFKLSYSIEDLPDSGNDIIILTTEKMTYGASALFYPGVLDRFSEYYGGDFIIMPQSADQMVLTPCPTNRTELDLLKRIHESIVSINIHNEDALPRNVYCFTSGSHELRIIEKFVVNDDNEIA